MAIVLVDCRLLLIYNF
jgi:cytochrome P450 family 6